MTFRSRPVTTLTAAMTATMVLVVGLTVSPAAAVVPGGSDADAFERLQRRLDAAPGVPWSVEGDLVVPALPDVGHILDALALDTSGPTGAYPSLAAALIGVESARSGSLFSQFVGDNLDDVAGLTGMSPFALARLDTSSVGAFDAGLRASGAGFALGSLDDLVSRLGGPVSGVDQATAVAASSFARQLWQLNMPQMPSAPMPQVDLAAAGFGLLTNRSLSAFATDFPDVFASVSASGLGSDEHRQAWSTSMLRAYQSSQQDLNAALPSSCLAGMMAVAASGQPSSATAFGSCGPDCQAAGMYLNNQMLGLWQPSAFSTQPVDDGVLSQSELSRLPGWLRDGVTTDLPQAPTTSSTLQGSLQGACATADPAAGAVRRVLPDVFDLLRQ